MVGSSGVTANGQRRVVAPLGMVVVNCGVCCSYGGKSSAAREFRFQRHADWEDELAGCRASYTYEKPRANVYVPASTCDFAAGKLGRTPTSGESKAECGQQQR